VLAEAGASTMLPQAELTPARLAQEVGDLLTDRPRRDAMAARALARGRPRAADEIVSRLLTLYGGP